MFTATQLEAIRDAAHRKADFLRDFPRYSPDNFSDPVMKAVIKSGNADRDQEIRWFRGVAYDAQALIDGCDDCLDDVVQALAADHDLRTAAYSVVPASPMEKAA